MKWVRIVSSVVLMTALAGCSQGTGTQDDKGSVDKGSVQTKISNEPITLTLYQHAAISNEEIDKFVVQPVKKKYPNISINIVRKGTGANPEDLVAAGIVPDLIYTTDANTPLWRDLDVPEDLNTLIKSNNFDLNRFDPNAIDSIKVYSGGKGAMYALPVMQNIAALLYNKDIFDKFAVPYPKDGMNWDEIIQLARKITRTDNGIRYIGLSPDNISRLGYGLSLPYVNPSTNKASINNDNWKKAFTTMKDMLDVPGFLGEDKKLTYGTNEFFKEGRVAMFTQWVPDMVASLDPSIADKVPWDFVSLPNYAEAIGTGRVISPHTIIMNKQSKYKNEAFEVMKIFTSDEVQSELSRSGKISVLTKGDLQTQYGANVPYLKGKNIAGIFKSKPRKINDPLTEYDVLVRSAIDAQVKELAAGKDVNTALRAAEEAGNKAIEEKLKTVKK
ncbi:extracellular solute-binding protein [Paenibacillus filicis]|uniref:Extracellular solute-binding protein n=1 Tax=Paenibacillus gyeongsangnamensis TaxID=3388067 RepID=A0ABT4Q4K5_9BACL|nr:extracellular solute-binding protein [Paenibacillus filicis]MCZ8511812.1 extracellular solute-binding protein [Paenibacillus filicis]